MVDVHFGFRHWAKALTIPEMVHEAKYVFNNPNRLSFFCMFSAMCLKKSKKNKKIKKDKKDKKNKKNKKSKKNEKSKKKKKKKKSKKNKKKNKLVLSC